MPFDVSWYDDAHSILRIRVYGKPTWDEYDAAMNIVSEHIAASPHRVDMILDDEVGMPRGNPMPHLKAALDKVAVHPNLGMSMAASARDISLFPSLMMETAGRLYGVDMKRYGRFVKSMDDAVAIIMADRAKEQPKSDPSSKD